MDDFLMSLSRELHHGLALAQDIKSNGPAQAGRRDAERTRTVDYFDQRLEFYFCAEEQYLFPLVETFFFGKREVVTLLKKQHIQLRSLIDQLRAAAGGQLENLLLRFAQVLEAHLRKEEWLFQRLPKEVPEEQLAACSGQIDHYLAKSGHHRR